ncbi:MAG: ribosome recycling factor [Candidatus Wildermuthbacteria bacterium RIFCSPLOWO2_02_FULL_47_9c]|uniref:Ribosome-recycling factor n=3 Tax=Parcubacteria group TaxID=1794811 RepID=A0A0G2AAI3_9BACT|nr:MAG: ribosome recycling factor, ribosome recycling factor [Candidatus Yanofskybacteria bacterium GW2011_GWC1_48_11]KKW04605.1 MAG: Ribosome-recycling factor [Parcubacteria group bacterium GW2011_GWB1_49_12]KKW09137.1 MAG: Ribosome-recycling factor [Parcubacteria group bacterium GW2011_GWA1_49_26]KKW29384.1 MAG: Ribosome-recycling factor [Candidatus Kaiserbacteria bacterium GW2011_GWC2_52_8b]OHA61394.1 MAG: ribosome recycling factor [Candidatus Wildermuthbacteria bacterium GWA1_49_26]OHA6626
MYQEVLQKIKPDMEKTVSFFQGELAKIRTGQATPSLVEDVQVNLFGQKMPLKQLAGISCPDRGQILIQPWDKSYIEPIEKALQVSSLGTSPIVEGAALRMHLPKLTQEYRLQLAKVLGEKSEETRRALRKRREDAWEEIQNQTKTGEIREDDKFRAKDELQKILDEYNKKIEDLVGRKKREIEVE